MNCDWSTNDYTMLNVFCVALNHSMNVKVIFNHTRQPDDSFNDLLPTKQLMPYQNCNTPTNPYLRSSSWKLKKTHFVPNTLCYLSPSVWYDCVFSKTHGRWVAGCELELDSCCCWLSSALLDSLAVPVIIHPHLIIYKCTTPSPASSATMGMIKQPYYHLRQTACRYF